MDTSDESQERSREIHQWHHKRNPYFVVGRREGIEEGRQEVAMEMLRRGFNIHLTSMCTKLSMETLEEIKRVNFPNNIRSMAIWSTMLGEVKRLIQSIAKLLSAKASKS